MSHRSARDMSCCLRPEEGGSAFESKFCFEATCGFTFVTALLSSADAAQVKGLLAFTPVGLFPTEHVYLFWTHSFAKTPAAFKTARYRNAA